MKDYISLIFLTLKRFYFEKYTYRASALTYTTVLALVPLLLVIVFFISVFPSFKHIVLMGENFIMKNFVPSAAHSLENYFKGFIDQATQLPATSVVFLALSTIMLIYTISDTMNDIWQVRPEKRRLNLLKLFISWLVFIATPFLIGVSVLITVYIVSLQWLPNQFAQFNLTYLLNFVPLLINTLVFSVLFVMVPNNVNVKWRDGLISGINTAIGFEVFRRGFGFYIKTAPTYSIIYGAFSTIPIFLLWLYLCWCIILFGALLTNMLCVRRLQSKQKIA